MKTACCGWINLFLVFFCQGVFAQDGNTNLNDIELYYRCYGTLTRSRPTANDPFIPQIQSSTMTGLAACQQLLELSRFGNNNQIRAYANDLERQRISRAVVSTIHGLHVSWFSNDQVSAGSNCAEAGAKAIYGQSEPALHFSRAFFDQDYGFDSVVRTNATDLPSQMLRAVRTQGEPTGNVFLNLATGADHQAMHLSAVRSRNGIGPYVDTLSPWGNIRFATTGSLLGIVPETDLRLPSALRRPASERTDINNVTNLNVMQSYGGGMLGSSAFLYRTLHESADAVSDLMVMPRKWSQEVYRSLLCRELPMIKYVDAKPYTVCTNAANCGVAVTQAQLNAKPALSFRTQQGCVQCHASMDPLAGVVRNFRYADSAPLGNCRVNESKLTSTHVFAVAPAKQLSTLATYGGQWPGHQVNEYWNTPVNAQSPGRLYFRDYNDVLKSEMVNNLNSLGNRIATLDDFYLCGTKRYFEFLTGISCDISPRTPAQVAAMDATDRHYRNLCVTFMQKFKSLQATGLQRDPMELIKAIMADPIFKQKNYGVGQNYGTN